MRILGDLDQRPAKDDMPKDFRKGHSGSVGVMTDPEESRVGTVGEVPLEDPGEHMGAATPPWQTRESWRQRDRSSIAEPPEWTRDPGRRPRPTRALHWILLVLTLALIGEIGYNYSVLRKGNISISQIPGMLQSMTTLSGRTEATEANLRDLATRWDNLADRVAQLDGKVNSSLRAARHQTQELVAQAEGRLREEMDRRAKVVDARLTQVESTQKDDHAQLAQLNDQLEKQVAALRGELAATQEGTNNGLAGLHQQVSQNEGALNTLAHQLQRQQVSFEIDRNSPTEITPGVSFTVLKTDTSYQRFRGYVTLTTEGRTVWLNNVGAQESVDLYPRASAHPYSLIITRVNPHGVVGYLLLPAGA
jgi:outer membrane murein-binding lipoprotein Lpp